MTEAQKRGKGRPPGREVTVTKNFRLSERDATRLDRLAEKWELPLVDTLRRMIRETAKAEGLE